MSVSAAGTEASELSRATNVTEPKKLPAVARFFRVVAFAEALSWLALLVGMFFKYGPTGNPIGVEIFGPIHGGIFVLYLLAVLICIRPLRWGFWTTVLALIASVPPFFTLLFEIWASRTGRLASPVAPPVTPGTEQGGSSSGKDSA